jgi:hypothetical protein
MVQLLSNGHLTQTDKKHIEALFKSGQTSGKINRATWIIEHGNPSTNEYILTKHVNDRGTGWIGSELRKSSYTFKIKFIKS